MCTHFVLMSLSLSTRINASNTHVCMCIPCTYNLIGQLNCLFSDGVVGGAAAVAVVGVLFFYRFYFFFSSSIVR